MATADFHAVGRRKSAVARVRLVPGEGKIVINKRDIDQYFGLETLKMTVRQPMTLSFRPEEGWLPDPRSAHERAQKVRPQGCPPRSAVQQALMVFISTTNTRC